MSQKRHSGLEVMRAGGWSAASLRMVDPRLWTNWSGSAPLGTRAVWVGYTTSPAKLVSRYCGKALGMAYW